MRSLFVHLAFNVGPQRWPAGFYHCKAGSISAARCRSCPCPSLSTTRLRTARAPMLRDKFILLFRADMARSGKGGLCTAGDLTELAPVDTASALSAWRRLGPGSNRPLNTGSPRPNTLRTIPPHPPTTPTSIAVKKLLDLLDPHTAADTGISGSSAHPIRRIVGHLSRQRPIAHPSQRINVRPSSLDAHDSNTALSAHTPASTIDVTEHALGTNSLTRRTKVQQHRRTIRISQDDPPCPANVKCRKSPSCSLDPRTTFASNRNQWITPDVSFDPLLLTRQPDSHPSQRCASIAP